MAPAKQKTTKASVTKKATKAVAAKADGEQRASWSIADETALILFLIEHKAEAGDGFNFKTTTFNAASLIVDAMRTKGATKTSRVCKNKWTQVCYMVSQSHFSNYNFSSKDCILLFQNSKTSLGSSGTRNVVQISTQTLSRYGMHI